MAAGANTFYRVTKALDGNQRTVKELSEQLNISEVTIRLAIKELTKEDKITRSPGFPAYYTLTSKETKIEPEIHDPTVDKMVKALNDKDYQVGREVLESVRSRIKEKGHEYVIDYLTHLTEAVRRDNERRGNAKSGTG